MARSAPLQLVEQPPVSISSVASNVYLVDFGRVAFGNLSLVSPRSVSNTITVHFGEAISAGRINRHPPGSVRYATVRVALGGGKTICVAPEADERNTKEPSAVLTPPEVGVVMPFRWVEIENWPGELRPELIRRRALFARYWHDDASSFNCSDPMLNQIWDLCRYSIKATTFAGVFVDGDRERISYEADAYLTQLSDYYVNGDTQMARDTFDRLMAQPTWPTEWAPHMVFMAFADYMQTGDTNWLARHYTGLKSKLLLDRVRADGLIGSSEGKIQWGDLVDWPTGERDGYVFTRANTVVNAMYLRALTLMAQMARALNRDSDAEDYMERERLGQKAFQEKFFDAAPGLYRDGEGARHYSVHANLFPLAFGLVPPEDRERIAQWLGSSGMKCSVYAAQYLLEGLFENGAGDKAIALMTAPGDRSWRHMVESGTTITWEAWDQRYKSNQDWNHAWGAAPANLLPRFVLGVQPDSPGWKHVLIQPNTGGLLHAEGKVPTPLGPVSIAWNTTNHFQLSVTLPQGMEASVEIPAVESSTRVFLDGKSTRVKHEGNRWILRHDVAGSALIEER